VETISPAAHPASHGLPLPSRADSDTPETRTWHSPGSQPAAPSVTGIPFSQHPQREKVPTVPALANSDLREALQRGRALNVQVQGHPSQSWVFQPLDVLTESFQVTLDEDRHLENTIQVYEGRPADGGTFHERISLALVGDELAAMIMGRHGSVVHVRRDAESDSFVGQRELPRLHCAASAHHEGAFASQGGGLSEEKLPAHISISHPMQASSGEDPLSGELILTDEPIPYPPAYDASLKNATLLLVYEDAGDESPGTLNRMTAEGLSLTGLMHTMYENQLGIRLQIQEIVFMTEGSVFQSPDTNDGQLTTFTNWAASHRFQPDYQWTLAAKIGSVSNANGVAWTAGYGTGLGTSINKSPTWGLVGHECGHNLGSNHSSGGIMNPSTNSSRDFFRTVESGFTAADDIYEDEAAFNLLSGAAPLRNPSEIPFAVDDQAVTTTNTPVVISPLTNDLIATPRGGINSGMSLEEVSAPHPLHSGSLELIGDDIRFTPSPGFEGNARFSYSIRGNTGNGGEGWLHKGDVGVRVLPALFAAPVVTAIRDTPHRTEIQWQHTGVNPIHWRILRSVGGGTTETLKDVDGRTRNWFDYELSPAADQVVYQVVAFDGTAPSGLTGTSTPLSAAGDVQYYDDFLDAGDPDPLIWDVLSADESSANWNDSAVVNPAVLSHQGDDLRLEMLNSQPTEQEVVSLLAGEMYNLHTEGPLSMQVTLGLPGDRRKEQTRRLAGWLDSNGAVLWTALDQEGDIMTFASPNLAAFFSGVHLPISSSHPDFLHQNLEGGRTSGSRQDRIMFTVSADSVAAASMSLEQHHESGARVRSYSTLGFIPHGIGGFSGTGQFFVGIRDQIPSGDAMMVRIDDLGITSEALPNRFRPGAIDIHVQASAGGTVLFYLLEQSFLSTEVRGNLTGGTPGIPYRPSNGAGGDRDLFAFRAMPAQSGVVELQATIWDSGYNNDYDGLTDTARVYVTVEQESAVLTTDQADYHPELGPLTVNLLLNDQGTGQLQPSQINTTQDQGEHSSPFLNAFRLVSASHNGQGSLLLETQPVTQNGVTTLAYTGRVTYTPASSDTGEVLITYTVEDATGAQTQSTFTLTRDSRNHYLVTVTGPASESGPVAGGFVLTRSGDNLNTNAMTIPFQLSGSVDRVGAGADVIISGASTYDPFTGMGMMQIPAGTPSATLTVTPVADGETESLETLELTVLEGPNVEVAGPVLYTLSVLDSQDIADIVWPAANVVNLADVSHSTWLEVMPLVEDLDCSWSVVTGPGVATFSHESAFGTRVLFSQAGTYHLEAAVSNASASETIPVTVHVATGSPGNTAAQVELTAGPYAEFRYPFPMSGNALDPETPSDSLSYEWRVLTIAGSPVVSNPTARNTEITFGRKQDFEVVLIAHDGDMADAALHTVTVDGTFQRYNSWKNLAFFPYATDVRDFEQDAVGNGVINGLEYAHQVFGRLEDVSPKLPQMRTVDIAGNTHLEITFRRIALGIGEAAESYTAGGVTYIVELNQSLVLPDNWVSGSSIFEQIGTPVRDGDAETVTVRTKIPIENSQDALQFIRLRLEHTPLP